jgi:hypothetical protein
MRLCKDTGELFNSRILDQATDVFHSRAPIHAVGAQLIMYAVIPCTVSFPDFLWHIKRAPVRRSAGQPAFNIPSELTLYCSLRPFK